jgi:hypothetical protein
MLRGEIFLAQFLLGDIPGMKLHLILLLTGPVGSVREILVAYICSVVPAQPLSLDLVINPSEPEFRSAHLKTISALRLNKLGTIHSSSLARYVGVVDTSTQRVIAEKLKNRLKL